MIIFINFFFFFSSVHAETFWYYGPNKLEITFLKENKVFISTKCLNTKPECLALQAIKNRQPGVIEDWGGANPGSRVCREKLTGKIFIATDGEGGTEAFCLFKDQSFVSLGGVWR